MKKILATFVVFATVIGAIAPQALALDIQITPQGVIQFYEDGVLGESDEMKNTEGKVKRNEERKVEVRSSKPIKTVEPAQRKEIRVKTDKREVQVELRDKKVESVEARKKNVSQTIESEHSETIETKRVDMRFPAAVREDSKAGQPAEDTEYSAKLKEERQGRKQELVELKTKLKNGEQRLELTSREVKAKIENGAEFTLDPETNQVTVTTPSGKVHVLTHLPDQAIERMKAVGLLSSTDASDTEVEVKTTEDGKVVYETEDVKQKRVFGLFKRKIKTKISLDDETGKVTETEEQPSSLLGQFLNSVAF